MIDRFDLEIDIRFCEDAATMYRCPNGKYVKYDEAQEKIDLVIGIFEGLKNVNIHNTTPDELNNIVAQAIEELKK